MLQASLINQARKCVGCLRDQRPRLNSRVGDIMLQASLINQARKCMGCLRDQRPRLNSRVGDIMLQAFFYAWTSERAALII